MEQQCRLVVKQLHSQSTACDIHEQKTFKPEEQEEGGSLGLQGEEMDRTEAQLLVVLLLLLGVFTQVWCQMCSGSCHCLPAAPRCPADVPLIADSCGCCPVCARREGEACSERWPCDSQRGLRCDYSASFPQGPGLCVGEKELGCEVDGQKLKEGQMFQPSCSQLCRCLGGGVTCVPLCSDDLQSPTSVNCQNPQLVRSPGRCCREWLCLDTLDNTVPSDPSAAVARRGDYGGLSNCIAWSSAWSPCSHSCGPGVSSRTSNRNPDCSLRTESRLCQVRPCQARLQGLRGLPSGVCESSFSLPVSVQLEYQGCWSTRAFRPRFCGRTCPEGHCCSPSRTRTTPVLFLCPQGTLIQQQVMMIQSCSCSLSACRQLQGPQGGLVHGPQGGLVHGPQGGLVHGPQGRLVHGPQGGLVHGPQGFRNQL